MDKGDAAPGSTGARDVVDQAVTRRAAGLESRGEVGHPIADVMNARSAPGQKSRDRAFRFEGGEQLHLGFSERQGHDGGAVGYLGRMGLQAKDIAIEGEGLVEVGHGHADMGDPGAIRHAIPPRGFVVEMVTTQENNIMAGTNTSTVHVTDASFSSEIEQANGLVLVDFWAAWCGPCMVVAPILDQLAGEYVGRAKVAKVDVDANQRTAMRFNVRSIPSILFFKNGQHVDTVVGAVPKATLEGKIKQHLV
jgi:thioredoxin 1